jgi:hypothetical protein
VATGIVLMLIGVFLILRTVTGGKQNLVNRILGAT